MLSIQNKEKLIRTLLDLVEKKLVLVDMHINEDASEELENLLYQIIESQEE